MIYNSDNLWICDDQTYTSQQIFESIKDYVDKGGKIYVGTDSMLRHDNCKFASVLAVHCNKMRVANYFFKKKTMPAKRYKSLQNKIFEEVNCSLEIAKEFSEYFPEAVIEVHVDVGKSNKSKTKIYVDTIKGWVTGLGFSFKIKPKSWASYIADWHSK